MFVASGPDPILIGCIFALLTLIVLLLARPALAGRAVAGITFAGVYGLVPFAALALVTL